MVAKVRSPSQRTAGGSHDVQQLSPKIRPRRGEGVKGSTPGHNRHANEPHTLPASSAPHIPALIQLRPLGVLCRLASRYFQEQL